MRDCAVYLWENHIDPWDATDIFFMGVGDSAIAVTHLLSHADDIQNRVKRVFNFISEHDLRAVSRAGDDYFIDWYFKHSDCFVAHDHQAWSPERTRRVRRKYGNLRRSGFNDLNEMLMEAKAEVTEKMYDITRHWQEAEQKKTAAPPPLPSAQRLPAMRTGHQFGEELKAPPSQPSPYLSYGGTPPYGHQPDIPVRGSPSASPRRDVLKSPVGKLPPVGKFSHSSLI
jgi:histone deacetylase 6